MNIVILSRNANLYSTKRLVEAGQSRGHNIQVVDYLRCYINITSKKPTIVYKGQELTKIDAVIPRIGASHTFYGTAIIRQFEMMGTYTLNKSQAISRSRDKLRCLQLLATKGIGMPATGCAHSSKDIEGLIEIAKGAPLVIKLLEGTQGIGVVLAETKNAAESVIEAFRGLNANILVQEFVKEANGEDIRCFVIGDKVVAAMMRKGAEGDFRSNIHRGGSGHNIKISSAERKTAINAACTLGLSVAGVDLLRSKKGPVVMEVNSSPGLEGIETTTQCNLAMEIIKHVEKHSKIKVKNRRNNIES